MKVKKWKLASFLLPCLLLFALIYLAPMCMVFGSSFFEWKAGGVFKFIGLDNYISAYPCCRCTAARSATTDRSHSTSGTIRSASCRPY